MDFSHTPHRYTKDLSEESSLRDAEKRAEILSDSEEVGRIRAYTMLGDIVADAVCRAYAGIRLQASDCDAD